MAAARRMTRLYPDVFCHYPRQHCFLGPCCIPGRCGLLVSGTGWLGSLLPHCIASLPWMIVGMLFCTMLRNFPIPTCGSCACWDIHLLFAVIH